MLHEIADRVRALEAELEANLHGSLLPALAAEGLRVLTLAECTAAERRRLTEMFEQEIFPVLTPLAVGPGRPFPYISNLSLSLGVFVVDPPTGEQRFARVKVPEVLPRFLALERGTRYVALEDVIADNLHRLFPGMEFTEHATFRVTRDADYDISEAAEDLLEAVEQELHARRFGDVVRLEVEATMSDEMRSVIVAALRVHPDHVYRARRPLDLADFFPLASLDRPDLHYRPWTPQTPAAPERRLAERRHVRRDPPRRHPRPPPLRRVQHVGGALHRAGRRRPRRARHQAHHLPHVRRLADRAGAGARGRAGQAGRGDGRGDGAVRRGAQHPLGALAGARRRARRATAWPG